MTKNSNYTKKPKKIEKVIKRNGEVVDFNQINIQRSILNCVVNNTEIDSIKAGEIAEKITKRVINIISIKKNKPSVEYIQDIVEEQLMAVGQFEVAKSYILYRDSRAKQRALRNITEEEISKVALNKKYFETPLQEFQFVSKYARFDHKKNRRETWEETVNRVITFFKNNVKEAASIDDCDWVLLHNHILELKSFPSMRVMQMAGPSLERDNVGVYNCAFIVVDSLLTFSEILYILMQGTGVGFSVESEYVDKLPRVKKKKKIGSDSMETFVIEDTTEGWCDALKIALHTFMGGSDINFDFSKIRKAGSVLKIKGGQASGPEPLMGLLDYVKHKIACREGKYLRSVDVCDLICKIAEIVQVGGVRRSSLISLSDIEDEEMRHAKRGQFWIAEPQRTMANNSVVYNSKPTSSDFMREWLSLAESGTGERGIFNRSGILKQMPKRRKRVDSIGTNPCGEILLRGTPPKGSSSDLIGGEFCNLSIAVARKEDTAKDLEDKVRVAAIFGTLQSSLTNFNYISEGWKLNCEEERLLGVDITGIMDCELTKFGAENRSLLFEKLKQIAVDTNKEYAEKLGITASVAVTCNKPSGNSSVLLNCSSGIHPRWSAYFIRHVRSSKISPLTQMLIDEGVPYFPENGYTMENTSQIVFAFPCKSPEGSILRTDLSAIEQLENWLCLKVNYTEHNPSVTIYVADNEWIEVANWVYTNFEKVGGISFLPKSDFVYNLAPYTDITEEQYNKLVSEFPNIDYSKLMLYEFEDTTEGAQEYACVSGNCDI